MEITADMDDDKKKFRVEGKTIDMDILEDDFDAWVHTERPISITHCSPDSAMAKRMKDIDEVYPVTRFVRGRALILSNASYQALWMLKDIFTQMNYVIKIETGKSEKEIRELIETESQNEDNQFVDSFVVVIYGTPDNFAYGYIPEALNDEKAPFLRGKPKLIYVIGDTDITQQLREAVSHHKYTDMFAVSTGFSGVMFYMYILARFAHELSAQSIWNMLLKYAKDHSFAASTQDTLNKQFYFFPGLTTSVFPAEIERLDSADMALYKKMLEEGSAPTYNIRLMFVGLYGAGKTTTARRIMEQSIDGVRSTDGIDVQIGRCKIDIRNKKWSTVHDSPGKSSNLQLRKLHLADRTSTRNIPDIKSLEKDEDRHQHDVDLAQSENGSFVNEATRPRETIVRRLEYGRKTRSKRSWSDASEDDDNCSLSSSQSSFTSGFERIQIRSDSESSTIPSDFEMVEEQHMDLEGSTESKESMRRARRVFEVSSETKGVEYDEAAVSLWDFAGQFVYYATHHLFFSPRSIYLLVVNLEDNLEKTLADWFMDIRGKQSIDERGGINFWLRSIYAYSRGSSSGVPPIILVGTHADKLKGDNPEKKKTADEYFKRIRNTFLSTPLINNICPKWFLLDNMSSNPNMDELKKYILSVSQTTPYWGEEIPAKWLELELALDEARKEYQPFITFAELQNIVKNLASPFKDKDKLELFLRAHHEQGTFVYFGDSEKLRDVIVLESQWIINAFRSLIAATDFAEKYGALQIQWEEFNETGRLQKNLAKHIWKLDTDPRFYENSDLLLQFLEELDIIGQPAVLNEKQTDTKKLEFHYVPCMLKETVPENIIPDQDSPEFLSTPVLCLSFKENFMPPAVFYRVIALCMKKWPVARNGKKILMFCGCAVFDIRYGRGHDLHRLYVFCRQSKIGLRITRCVGKTTHALMVDPNICDEVRRFITSAVKKEFSRFQEFNTASVDVPFFYQLQCKDTVEKDAMDEGLHHKEDLVNALDMDFFCAEHSDRLDPHSLKAVEMLHEWFNDDIPENFRFKGYSSSVIDTWTSKLPDTMTRKAVTERSLSRLSNAVGKHWRRMMEKHLGLKEVIVDQIVEDSPQNIRLQILNCLLTWKGECDKNNPTTATNGCILNALKAARSKGIHIDFEEVQNVFEIVLTEARHRM